MNIAQMTSSSRPVPPSYFRSQAWYRLCRQAKYHTIAPGFLRMNVCGWRLVLIDTEVHRPCYSDRLQGWRLGRFLINFRPVGSHIRAAFGK